MLSTVLIINISYARAINIDEAEVGKDTITILNKYFNAFFMSANYDFIMSSTCNTVMLVKTFETAIYMLKIEVG